MRTGKQRARLRALPAKRRKRIFCRRCGIISVRYRRKKKLHIEVIDVKILYIKIRFSEGKHNECTVQVLLQMFPESDVRRGILPALARAGTDFGRGQSCQAPRVCQGEGVQKRAARHRPGTHEPRYGTAHHRRIQGGRAQHHRLRQGRPQPHDHEHRGRTQTLQR